MSSLVSSRFGAIRAASRHGSCLGMGAKNKIPVTDLDLYRQRSFLIELSPFSSPANLVLFAMRCYSLISKCDKNQPASPPTREKLQQLAPYPASCGLLCSLDGCWSHRGGSTINDCFLTTIESRICVPRKQGHSNTNLSRIQVGKYSTSSVLLSNRRKSLVGNQEGLRTM